MRICLSLTVVASLLMAGALTACHSDTHDVRPAENRPSGSPALPSGTDGPANRPAISDMEPAQAGTQAAEAIGVADPGAKRQGQ